MAIFDMKGADDAGLRYHSFVKRSKFHVSPSTPCLSLICQCAKTADIETVLGLDSLLYRSAHARWTLPTVQKDFEAGNPHGKEGSRIWPLAL